MSREPTWRETFAPRIAKMISEMKAEGKTVKEMKKVLCDKNPGPYGHHRKTWANEYMIQLGLSRRKGAKPIDRNLPKLF